jgi:hypothetical protein
MGAAISSNVIQSTMKSITNVSSTIAQKQKVSLDSSQIISISNTRGDVILRDNVQNVVANLNAKALMTALSTTEARTALTSELQQTAKSLISGINLGQLAHSYNVVENYMEAMLNLVTNIGQTCEAKARQTQEIRIDMTYGSVKITNTLQNALLNAASECILDAVSQSTAVTDLQTLIDQSAEAEAKGISEWAIVALAIIGLLALVLPIVLPIALGASKIMQYLILIIGVLMIVGGIGMVIWYFVDQYDIMVTVPFSKLISEFKDVCGATASNTTSEYKTAEGAGQVCLRDPSCKGFDWQNWSFKNNQTTIIDPPQSTFFSEVDENCAAIRGAQADQPRLIVERNYSSGFGPPKVEADTEDGDLYINKDTGRMFIFNSVEQEWIEQSGDPIPLFRRQNNILFGNSEPGPSLGEREDVFVNVKDPLNWVLYVKTTGQDWTKVSETVKGPGFLVHVPPPNTSGFKVRVKQEWRWIVGVTLAVLGLLVVLFYWFIGRTHAKGHEAPAPKSTSKTETK